MDLQSIITILMAIGVILWIAVYVLILSRSFKDKTYGVPMFAICANLSWEFIFSFVQPYLGMPWALGFYAWLALDLVVLYTYIRYGRKEFPDGLPSWWFWPCLIVTLGLCFLGILCITYEFLDWFGLYSAFSQCLIMSILFIHMALRRPGLEGQSLYSAVARWLATAICAFVCYLIAPDSKFRTFLYICIFCFDAVYVYIIYRKSKDLGFNPWRRI